MHTKSTSPYKQRIQPMTNVQFVKSEKRKAPVDWESPRVTLAVSIYSTEQYICNFNDVP